MSAANIAVVKRIYEGFDTGDVSKILNSMAEDVSFDHRGADAPDFPINKLFEGKSGVQEFIDTIFDTQEILAHDVHEFFPSGDKVAVVGFFKTRVKATSKEFSTNWAQVWTIKDGLVTAWRVIFDSTAAALAYQQ